MPRITKINWREVDTKRLTNAVRRANSIIARAVKANPTLSEFAPSRFDVNTIRAGIFSRSDFNKELNRLNRLTTQALKPITTSGGAKTTAYELRELNISKSVINRRRSLERKKAGEVLQKGTMGTLRQNNLLPRKFNLETIPKSRWDEFVKGVFYASTDKFLDKTNLIYRQNFRNKIIERFGYDPEITNELLTAFDRYTPEMLLEVMYDNPYINIDYVYDEHDDMIVYNNLLISLKTQIELRDDNGFRR